MRPAHASPAPAPKVLAGNALLPHTLEGRGPFDSVVVGADARADQLPALLPLLAPHGEAASNRGCQERTRNMLPM
jgi:hypothetical protein